ncbi:myeloid cell surface antigen CD33-like [Sorex araneus]|uniref:myeloid cell surface antigen CD33-like n=1 Tax=Sorex araneus TaxID=42254 RepID=UPI002433D1EC|nr:myeloid cell surface antigen CD33-like [Sorex araneus]
MLPLLLLPLLWAGSLAQGADYTMNIKSHVTVQEGLCVKVPCNFTVPDAVASSEELVGSWFQKGSDNLTYHPVASSHPTQQVEAGAWNHFLFSGNVSANSCTLIIRNARKEDEGEYFFSVSKGSVVYNYMDNLLSVSVTDNTVVPTVLTIDSMDPGRHIICLVPQSCEWETSPFFTWLSPVLSSLGPRTTHSSILNFFPEIEDRGTRLTCQVYYSIPGVVREKVIVINVTCNPENPESCASSKQTNTVKFGWFDGAIVGTCVTVLLGVLVYFLFFM